MGVLSCLKNKRIMGKEEALKIIAEAIIKADNAGDTNTIVMIVLNEQLLEEVQHELSSDGFFFDIKQHGRVDDGNILINKISIYW